VIILGGLSGQVCNNSVTWEKHLPFWVVSTGMTKKFQRSIVRMVAQYYEFTY